MGKYKKFKNTKKKTIILDKYVEVKWHARNIPHYQSIGYTYTGRWDKFWCHIDDLSPGSTVKVTVMCPICGKSRLSAYQSIMKCNHTLCPGCCQIADLTGLTFGRLTVLDFDVVTTAAKWICECECGNIVSVRGNALTSGVTVSCGCYHNDLCRSRFGENSPTWNKNISEEERIISRKYKEYKDYIKEVLKRDQYQCQICGSIDKKLEVHHLYSYAAYKEFSLSPEFGITICQEEHKEFHSWMGGKHIPCTPSDFQRWLYTIS